MAIQKYNVDQTGPKTQLGGFQEGFVRVAYQVSMEGIVIADPTAATAKHAPIETARPTS
jgi:hypothetical protein